MSDSELHIVFVCTGNVCRSPMAECLMRHRLGRDTNWLIESAGLAAAYGMPASAHAVKVLQEWGLDLSGHRSQPLDSVIVESADMLVVMTGAHREHIRSLYPDQHRKVYLLKSFSDEPGDGSIPDPIGLSIDVYRGIREEIDEALPGLVDEARRLAASKGRT